MDKQRQERLKGFTKQGETANQKLIDRYDRMGNAFDYYAPLQRSYFEILEAIAHLRDDSKVIIDLFIVIPIFMGVIIDYIFFHSPVEYFLKLLVLSETVKAILTIGLLLLYLAIEVKNRNLYLSAGGKIEYFPVMMESELASDIYIFIDERYNASHPAMLPSPYPRLFGYPHLGGGNDRKLIA
jgi:hypothetical protein